MKIDLRAGVEDAIAGERRRQLYLPIGELKKLNLARTVARLADVVALRRPSPVEIDGRMESEGTHDSPVGQQTRLARGHEFLQFGGAVPGERGQTET